MLNIPNLRVVSINAYADLGKFYQSVRKKLSGNKILTSRATSRYLFAKIDA